MASYVHLTVCQGNTAEFLNAIDEVNAILEEYDEEYDVDRFYLVAAAYQARMHIFLADRQAVDQWAKAYPDSPFEYAELTLVRYLLMSQGNTAEFLNAIDEVNAILEEYDEEYDVDRFYFRGRSEIRHVCNVERLVLSEVERPAQQHLPEPLTEQELNILALFGG